MAIPKVSENLHVPFSTPCHAVTVAEAAWSRDIWMAGDGAAMARCWRGDGWHPTPEAGRDLNGFVVCVCDAKQSTDSMIWQGYTKTKSVQQWLQMAKTRRKYIHLKAVIFLPSNVQQIDTISVSGHSCMHFIWNFLSNGCRHKNDPSISRMFFIYFLAGFCTLAEWWCRVACRSLADHFYVWKVEMGLICFGKLILDRCVCSMSTTKLSWH